MKFPFHPFPVLIISGISLIFNFLQAQPFQWQVWEERSASCKFTVRADSILALTPDLFVIHLGKESILFRESPFRPLSREKRTAFLSLNQRFFGKKTGGIWKLYECRHPEKPGFGNFQELKCWRKQIIAVSAEGTFFFPEEGDEIQADSLKSYPDKLHFFQKDGILWVDSLLARHFYKTGSGNRGFNQPWFSYVLSDSNWIPLNGRGLIFKALSASFWWNDTTLLDTSELGVFMQTPSRIRRRTGDSVRIIDRNFLCLYNQKKTFVFTSQGRKMAVPFSLQQKSVCDSICGLRLAKNWLLLSQRGNRYPIKPVVTELGPQSGGLLLARAGRRWGCTDLSGIIRISCRYDSLLPLSMGLIAARIGNSWGFLNRDERIVIQPNYDSVQPFRDSVSLVGRDGKFGLLRMDGSLSFKCEFDAMQLLKNRKWKLRKELWTGIGDPKGFFLLKPRYSNIIETQTGLWMVERDGRNGLFNQNGALLMPLEYSLIIPDSDHGLLIAR
jgi:hypothetical protein